MKSESGLRHHMSSLHLESRTVDLRKEETIRRKKEKENNLFCEKCLQLEVALWFSNTVILLTGS